VRGQRTHTNARTRKGVRKTVGVVRGKEARAAVKTDIAAASKVTAVPKAVGIPKVTAAPKAAGAPKTTTASKA
jgi:hypothetical protein